MGAFAAPVLLSPALDEQVRQRALYLYYFQKEVKLAHRPYGYAILALIQIVRAIVPNAVITSVRCAIPTL